jgi:hypothetical protein
LPLIVLLLNCHGGAAQNPGAEFWTACETWRNL